MPAVAHMDAKALDLFQAYVTGKLPWDRGWAVAAAIDERARAARYDVIAYRHATGFHLSQAGLTVHADGDRLFVLVEPAEHPDQDVEPFLRESPQRIPHCFAELKTLTTADGTRIMMSDRPVCTYAAFDVPRPIGDDFAFLFYDRADLAATVTSFLQRTLHQESGVSPAHAKRAATAIGRRLALFR